VPRETVEVNILANIDKAVKNINKFGTSLQNAGKKLSLFVTAPLVGLGIAAVKSAADMEMQQAAFETMLGSAEKARDMLAQLTQFAAKTPFQLTDLAQGTKTLLGFGVEAQKVLPYLRQLGDVAQGNSGRFQQLTLAFAQIQATGRLMGQDLLQLINAGFNPLQVISEQTGKSMAELKKQMEKGGISAEQVAEAFKIATAEGGRFYGGMEKASQTLNGLVSTLKDNLALLGRSLAEILLPALKRITERAIQIAQHFQNLDERTRRIIVGMVGFAAAVGPVLIGIGSLMKAIKTATIIMHAFNLTNPIGWIILATAAAATLAYVIVKNWRQIELAAKRVFTVVRDYLVWNFGKVVEAVGFLAAQVVNAFNWIKSKVSREEFVPVENVFEGFLDKLQATRMEMYDAGLSAEEYRKQLEALRKEKERAESVPIPALPTLPTSPEMPTGLAAPTVELPEMNALTAARESGTVAIDAQTQALIALDHELERFGKLTDNSIDRNALMAQSFENMRWEAEQWANFLANTAVDAYQQSFEALGEAIIKGEEGWKSLGQVMKDTIAGLLRALGQQALVEAALQFARPFGLGVASGLRYLAAAATAFTAAGIVKSLAKGGSFETSGPQMVMVGDNPGGRERVDVTPVSSAGAQRDVPIHVVINLDGRVLSDFMTRASRNGQIRIDPRTVK
jgi:tape measure domain-containing protein